MEHPSHVKVIAHIAPVLHVSEPVLPSAAVLDQGVLDDGPGRAVGSSVGSGEKTEANNIRNLSELKSKLELFITEVLVNVELAKSVKGRVNGGGSTLFLARADSGFLVSPNVVRGLNQFAN